MQVELSLREAQTLKAMLDRRVEDLKIVNDANYPHRKDDILLSAKLERAADPHWNK